jgi:hypothetical protein
MLSSGPTNILGDPHGTSNSLGDPQNRCVRTPGTNVATSGFGIQTCWGAGAGSPLELGTSTAADDASGLGVASVSMSVGGRTSI